MEVPGLGVNLELQLPAYTTAIVMWELSHIFDLQGSLQQHQILNPPSNARDWPHILMDTTWVLNLLSHSRNPCLFFVVENFLFFEFHFGIFLLAVSSSLILSGLVRIQSMNELIKCIFHFCWYVADFNIFFFWLHPQHMTVPRSGIKSKLQLQQHCTRLGNQTSASTATQVTIVGFITHCDTVGTPFFLILF